MKQQSISWLRWITVALCIPMLFLALSPPPPQEQQQEREQQQQQRGAFITKTGVRKVCDPAIQDRRANGREKSGNWVLGIWGHMDMVRTPGRTWSWADDQRLSGNGKSEKLFFFFCLSESKIWISGKFLGKSGRKTGRPTPLGQNFYGSWAVLTWAIAVGQIFGQSWACVSPGNKCRIVGQKTFIAPPHQDLSCFL